MTKSNQSIDAVLAQIARNQARGNDSIDHGRRVDAVGYVDAGTAAKRPQKLRKKAQPGKFRKEDNITVVPQKNGSPSYRVQIRARVEGKIKSLSKSFKHLPNAKSWRDKKKAEIELHGFPNDTVDSVTVSDAINDRLSRGRDLGRSAKQNLNWIKDSYLGNLKAASLTSNDIYSFAEHLLSGERLPQTAAGYMTHLASALDWAARRGTQVPIEVVRLAMSNMWEDELLARSEARERRPSLCELDQIMTAIHENKRQKIPVGKILVFAIFSTRRISEICRLRWEDLKADGSQILVREMKHPRKKKMNNVWCDLPPEAFKIINSMPKCSEFIFPFNPRSVQGNRSWI